MKLRKLFIGATLAVAAVAGLASCTSSKKELTYTDSEGKVQKQVLQATQDEQEVTKDVVALANQEYKVEKRNSVKAELSLEADVKAKIKDQDSNIKGNVNLTCEAQLPTYAENKKTEDYLSELAFYASVGANVTLPNGLAAEKLASDSQTVALQVETYYEQSSLYLNVAKADLDLAKLLGAGEESEAAKYIPMINNVLTALKANIYKFSESDISNISALLPALIGGGSSFDISGAASAAVGNEQVGAYINIALDLNAQDKLSLAKIKEVLNKYGVEFDVNQKELEEGVANLVKTLGLQIKAVNGNNVTFAITKLGDETNFELSFTLDISSLNLVDVKFDLSNLVTKYATNAAGESGTSPISSVSLKGELKLSYNVEVHKLTDEQKKGAKGLMDLAAALSGQAA